tara:strand:+ start:262 stop:645 length:384 start_codon:yes stop_codon:yes gene_type:complete
MRTNIMVQWGDMDAYQHVNNAVFLKWLETDRISFARELLPKYIEFIVAHISIDYLKPVTYPDNVCCESRIEKIGNTSVVVVTEIHSEEQKQVIAKAKSVLVNFDYNTNKSAPWDDQCRSILSDFLIK